MKMDELTEIIKSFKSEPISKDIIKRLTEVNRKFGMICGSMKHLGFSDIVSEMLLINEIKFHNNSCGKKCEYSEISSLLVREDDDSELKQEIYSLKQCLEFISDKCILIGMPLPTDVIYINDCFMANTSLVNSDSILKILLILFDEDSADDLLINTLVFYYAVNNLQPLNRVSQYVIDIVSSLYFKGFCGELKNLFFLSKLVLMGYKTSDIHEYILYSLEFISIYLDEILV